MKLQTPITDARCKVGISYNDRIMMLGSCFADNIGRQMKDYGFDVCVNPFGTLYNPISILQSIRTLVCGRHFTEQDCVEMGAGAGMTCSFSHHTSFARKETSDFLADANKALDQAREYIRSCNKVIITLGTSWCFRHIETGNIVSNCLKRPSGEFIRERLSPRQTEEALREIMQLCNAMDGATCKEFIFTVSPIRHFKDGAHGNQISKASLLLGIEEIVTENDIADYFPAYEIMMDELRDYRFYAEDMCHPSEQATGYIRDRFLSWALPEDEKPELEENIRSHKRSIHISMK